MRMRRHGRDSSQGSLQIASAEVSPGPAHQQELKRVLSELFSPSYILQPLRLVFKIRWSKSLSKDRLVADDYVVVVLLEFLLATGTSVAVYNALGRSIDADGLVRDLLISFFFGILTVSFVPVIQPFRRWSETAPLHWPVSAVQRAMGDVAYAIPSFWTVFYLSICVAVALSSPPSTLGSGFIACSGAMLATISISFSFRLIVDWKMGYTWVKATSAVLAVVVLALMNTGRANWISSSELMSGLIPMALVAQAFSSSLSAQSRWTAACMAALHGCGWTMMYLLLFKYAHWQWRESAFEKRSRRAQSNLINRLQRFSCLSMFESEIQSIALQQISYLLRSSRFWFLMFYGPIVGSFIIFRGGSEREVVFRVFVLTLCFSGSTCMFLYNMFAFDGESVWQWLFLPVRFRDLALGKNVAIFLASTPSIVLLMIVTTIALGAGLDLITASALLYLYFLLTHASVGNVVSLTFPTHVDLRNMWTTFISPQGGLILMTALVVFSGCSVVVWHFAMQKGIPLSLGQGLLTLPGILFYRKMLMFPEKLYKVRREEFASRVSRHAHD